MKKYLYLCVFLLVACGSRTPFQRGEKESLTIANQKVTGNNGGQTPAGNEPTDDANPNGGETPDDDNPPPVPVADFDRAYFDSAILPVLDQKCNTCHDNPAPDFATAKTICVFNKPEESKLYNCATGKCAEFPKHKAVLKPESAEAMALASWIKGGVSNQ